MLVKAGHSLVPARAEATGKVSAGRRFPARLAGSSRVKRRIAAAVLSSGRIKQRSAEQSWRTGHDFVFTTEGRLKTRKQREAERRPKYTECVRQLLTAANGLEVPQAAQSRARGAGNVTFPLPFLQSFLMLP